MQFLMGTIPRVQQLYGPPLCRCEDDRRGGRHAHQRRGGARVARSSLLISRYEAASNRENLELIRDILKNGGHAGCDKLFRESDSSPRQDGCPETSQ